MFLVKQKRKILLLRKDADVNWSRSKHLGCSKCIHSVMLVSALKLQLDLQLTSLSHETVWNRKLTSYHVCKVLLCLSARLSIIIPFNHISALTCLTMSQIYILFLFYKWQIKIHTYKHHFVLGFNHLSGRFKGFFLVGNRKETFSGIMWNAVKEKAQPFSEKLLLVI